MRYGRRPRRNDYKNNKKGKARPKLALAGAIILGIGILGVFYGINIHNFDIGIVFGFAVMVGTVMLLFSLSKKNQGRFVKGVDVTRKVFQDECQCCKCQNCGQNHNHWIHD